MAAPDDHRLKAGRRTRQLGGEARNRGVERFIVAAEGERQVGKRIGGEFGADLRTFGLQQGRLASHFHRLRRSANDQGGIYTHGGIDVTGMLRCVKVWKPSREISISEAPGGIVGKVYDPSVLVWVSRTWLVCTWVILTLAPGTLAVVGSVTFPASDPYRDPVHGPFAQPAAR